ncbi:MAG: adenosylcobinamide-phosphate synthase CbiB [Burkholderia sp.]|nr:adenosylcobinamide-phosphate synthase CbiB [Burkholderia sp.]
MLMMFLPDVATLTVIAVIADYLLGEPPSEQHILVIFGRFGNRIENILNIKQNAKWISRILGIAAWLLVITPPVLFFYLLIDILPTPLGAAIHAMLLWFALGAKSLNDHVYPIISALIYGDLYSARVLTAKIVSRDTSDADEHELVSATIESILENGNDAIFSALFWFIIAGGPGTLMFRLTNTLDAMWGYKTSNFLHFGYAAARIDDIMNWFPARLTAISYGLLGDTTSAWRCWNIQAHQWDSPNAGTVMSSGAGSLNIKIGGPAIYQNVAKNRLVLGTGEPAIVKHITMALTLVMRTLILWLAFLLLCGLIRLSIQYIT